MSRYGLHPEAYEDINEIRSYIAMDSPESADRVVDEIFHRLQQLAEFPGQGFRRPSFTNLPLRFVPLRSYLIVYAPKTGPVWVVAVLDGRRNPRVIASLLRGRE